MESLSRPFHSRKLSNATSSSTKNAYADVFSGHRHKFAGASTIDVADYREIFGSSQANCSIPVLDVSTLTASSDASNLNLRHSKPDYSNIFGGFRDEQVAFCYDELLREPSLKSPTLQDLDNSSNQSSDALKTFNMSYNKISPKSKDGLDGTKHVTQLPATPGFTYFIDEPVPVSPPKMEAKKNKSSPVCGSVDSSKENPSVPKVKKCNTFDIDFGIRSSTVSSPSASPIIRKSDPMISAAINSEPHKTNTSESGPGGFSHTYIDEEIDVNSDASASAAALRKAIEKAQESIRIAKESVGRKKKGLKSFSKKGRTEDVTAATSSQVFPDVSTNRKYGGPVNYQGFMDGEKLFVAKKVIDEMNGKISESTKECCNRFEDNNTIVSKPTQVTCETESRSLGSAGKDECATSSSEAVDTEKTRTESSDFVHAYHTNNMVVDDYEAKIKVIKTNTGILEHLSAATEQQSVEIAYELDDTVDVENKDEVRLSNAHELAEELFKLYVSQDVEDEKEESQGSTQNDREKSSNEIQENVENAEGRSHGTKTDNEASEGIESENEFKDDDHKGAEAAEILFDVCEREMNEYAQTYDNSVEDSEVNLRDDCEIKQEDNHTGEIKEESLDGTVDQEFDEASSCDNNVIEETAGVDEIHVASNIIDMSDNVETTQDVDDVAGAFHESQVEETELMKQTDASEEEAFSDDNEDDYEVKFEENDTQSESSSGTIHDVKIEVEESNEEKIIPEETNIQVPDDGIPDINTTNEIKVSQKTRVLNGTEKPTVDKIGETGPSKVSGKENSRRIDEMTAKNNRLAVDRAIREARERAFAEARERAERERAAVEKATEEVRERMMADAREKVVGNKSSSSDRTSAQSKLRAERAAVERATAEARQRALEKAISQKNVSDLNISESALRTKAKLEKHNRIMERAAKALAEKEKRDLLAQKEQAERNRLAENLDADIKRWSNGKEKNLRALLSTLQYILGPESGWKPVTMTEIISSSAVKKAYRKATLCVHPDKLQQRGASIQHKYICEKVFDLLKAAWNRFNSEEK